MAPVHGPSVSISDLPMSRIPMTTELSAFADARSINMMSYCYLCPSLPLLPTHTASSPSTQITFTARLLPQAQHSQRLALSLARYAVIKLSDKSSTVTLPVLLNLEPIIHVSVFLPSNF